MKKKSYIYTFLWIFVSQALPVEALDFHVVRKAVIGNQAEDLKIESDYEAGQLGSQMASGDFNGDGIDDLLVSAPFATTNGKEWNGAVDLYFGGKREMSEKITFTGSRAGDQLGSSLAAGDFNGDGIDDVAIGAFNALANGKRVGRVYTVLGVSQATGQMTNQNFAEANIYRFSLTPREEGSLFGLTIKSEDLNNDGYSDLLVGAPSAKNQNFDSVGAVHTYFGTRFGLSSNPGKTIYGQETGEMFGASIETGYLNGDDKIDFLIGAYRADKNDFADAGVVYYFENAISSINHNQYQKTFTGSVQNEWFGFNLATGDLNNDGYDDAAMTAFPYRAEKNVSKAAVYYGGDEFYNLFSDVSVSGSVGNSLIGSSVKLEDINDDGYLDLIVGAPAIGKLNDGDSGKVYIIYGDEEGFSRSYYVANSEVDTVIYGQELDDWFGYSLEVLDLDNDGFSDLVIGARYADGESTTNDGAIFVLFGDGTKLGSIQSGIDTNNNDPVNRGEFVAKVVNSFKLETEKEKYVSSCYDYLEFCLFNFIAASYYDGIQLEPELILYPDVQPDHQFYKEINLATILGVVNGFMGVENSPFSPDSPITRIQALKVIFGATDLVDSRYRFQLAEDLGGDEMIAEQESLINDVDPEIAHMWWYPRYTNFAAENGIIESGENFRPDDLISSADLDRLIIKTIEYLKEANEEIES